MKKIKEKLIKNKGYLNEDRYLRVHRFDDI